MKENKHKCGNDFEGEIIESHGIVFCGFCGKELEEKTLKFVSINALL